MLSEEQRSAFAELGILRLPGAIDSADVTRMREALWEALRSEHRIDREAPETWTVLRPSGFQKLVRSHAFASVGSSAAVGAALDDLLGSDRWHRPQRWGSPLVTFPSSAGAWDVPHREWHFDVPADRSATSCPGVNVFAYLDRVEPRGGGTVVVTGSHRLAADLASSEAAPLRSAELRKELGRSEPWLRALFSDVDRGDRVAAFMTESATVRGIPLRAVELTADAGDVVFMDLRILHAFAPNFRSTPRLMLAQHVYRVG